MPGAPSFALLAKGGITKLRRILAKPATPRTKPGAPSFALFGEGWDHEAQTHTRDTRNPPRNKPGAPSFALLAKGGITKLETHARALATLPGISPLAGCPILRALRRRVGSRSSDAYRETRNPPRNKPACRVPHPSRSLAKGGITKLRSILAPPATLPGISRVPHPSRSLAKGGITKLRSILAPPATLPATPRRPAHHPAVPISRTPPRRHARLSPKPQLPRAPQSWSRPRARLPVHESGCRSIRPASQQFLAMSRVVGMPRQNRERPVHLLRHHHPRQFVRQRHRA